MSDRLPVIKRVRGKALPPGAVYVGRGSRWGDPYLVGIHGSREECVALYCNWIAERPHLVDALAARRPTSLACWCAPLPCHADALAELLAARS